MKVILILLLCSYFVLEDYRSHIIISLLLLFFIIRSILRLSESKEKYNSKINNYNNEKCKDYNEKTVNYTNEEYIEGLETIDKFRENLNFNKNHFSQTKMNNILKNKSSVENFIPRDYYDKTVIMDFDKYFENNSYKFVEGI